MSTDIINPALERNVQRVLSSMSALEICITWQRKQANASVYCEDCVRVASVPTISHDILGATISYHSANVIIRLTFVLMNGVDDELYIGTDEKQPVTVIC